MSTTAWVAPAWGGRAVSAERLSRSQARRRLLRAAVTALGVAAVAGGVWAGLAETAAAPIAVRGGVSLWRTASGLAIAAPFDRAEPVRDIEDTFSFNGSASPGVGYVSVSADGLSVGIHRHSRRFEGWFAVTRSAFPASGVYHVRMAKPPGHVHAPGAQGEAVFAVQTGTTKQTGLINYVVVASDSNHGTTTWTVGYAHGYVADARLETLARFPAARDASPARDVTVLTDGGHRLDVWFGQRLVYSSDRLHLDIAPPFQPYLEVQSRRVPYRSTFTDFWVTTGTTVEVAAPDGARLRLVGHDGDTLATATARRGTARLVLPPPRASGVARLSVRLGGRSVVLGPFPYTGGDRYRLAGLRPATTAGASSR